MIDTGKAVGLLFSKFAQSIYMPRYQIVFLTAAWVLAILGCQISDPRFSSPAATFKTYRHALADRNFNLLWDCYSNNYKASLPAGHHGWLQEWTQKSEGDFVSDQRREIIAEQLINDRIGYLLFESNTLRSKQESPFFYFIRDPDGWKITSYQDSVFHRELERAIDRGEFQLPAN